MLSPRNRVLLQSGQRRVLTPCSLMLSMMVKGFLHSGQWRSTKAPIRRTSLHPVRLPTSDG